MDDAVDVVFDGVFCGEEFGIDGVDAAEPGVEGGSFSSTGGTGDDEDAVGFFDGFSDVFVDGRGESEVFEREVDGRAVEDAEHHGFAVLGGEC